MHEQAGAVAETPPAADFWEGVVVTAAPGAALEAGEALTAGAAAEEEFVEDEAGLVAAGGTGVSARTAIATH